jgi:hypothetical protein
MGIGRVPTVPSSRMAARQLSHLRNIGNTDALRFGEVRIQSDTVLGRVGAAKAYRLRAAQRPGKHLPVC